MMQLGKMVVGEQNVQCGFKRAGLSLPLHSHHQTLLILATIAYSVALQAWQAVAGCSLLGPAEILTKVTLVTLDCVRREKRVCCAVQRPWVVAANNAECRTHIDSGFFCRLTLLQV